MSDPTACTCGSGGHPRHCSAHPLAYRAHCCLLNAYAQIPDCPEWELLAYEATLAEWEDAERADWLQRVEAAAPKWQPIETAPRDGTRVLICWQDTGVVESAEYRKGAGWTGAACFWIRDPSHWMPLPGAPRE